MHLRTFPFAAACALMSWASSAPAYEIQISGGDNKYANMTGLYTGQAAFQCSFADGRAVNDAGKLDASGPPVRWFRERYNNFVFDAGKATLAVQGQTTQWSIVRHGNAQDDLIAYLPSEVDPLFNQLRIEVWAKPVRFWMTDGTDAFSGLCDRLR